MNEPVQIALAPLVDRRELEAALDQGREALDQDTNSCLSQFSWPLVRGRIAESIGETLRTDGLLWLAHGWSAAMELRAFKDPARYPPGKPSFLKLGKHKLSGALHPKVVVRCAGQELTSVTFDVPVTAEFNAITLTIQDAAVTGLGGGECAISLQIRYRGAVLSPKLPVRTIPLPGSYDFPRPLAIP